MIVPTALSSLCFPWMLINVDGSLISEGNGALFHKPRYQKESILAVAASLANGGWSVCPNGYAMYRFSTNAISPAFVVLHGLKVSGVSTIQGRSLELSINLSKENVVKYAQEYCAGLESLDDKYRVLIRQNIHEVRGINSGLYNSAFQLQEMLETEYGRGVSLSKSVVSWSELLRGRIDFMEFIASQNDQGINKGDVFVYKKVDKIQRCFRVTANQRGIDFELGGASVKAIYGPPIFDLVPYLLLDNAVKYSPDRRPVRLLCNDGAKTIFFAVTSRGPRISASELKNIFSSGVRGENALRSKKEGSGLGLTVLRKIVEDIFSGEIEIRQSEDKETINSVPYCDVTFEIKLPSRN